MREKKAKLLAGIKKVVFAKKEMFKTVVTAFIISCMMFPVTVSASGGGYTTAITNLKTVLLQILVPVGAVLLIFGIIRFAIAFQKLDQNGEHQALYTIIAAGILLGGSAIVAALS